MEIDSEEAGPHMLEITTTQQHFCIVFRFFGHGAWKVKRGGRWVSINPILVPGDVLHAAATQCRVVPRSAEGLRNSGP